MDDEPMSRERFAALVGSTFRVGTGGGPPELTLAEVSTLRSSPRTEAFTLVFSGPADEPLAQGEVHLEQAGTVGVDLFVVPIGRGAEGRLEYEAIINRLLD